MPVQVIPREPLIDAGERQAETEGRTRTGNAMLVAVLLFLWFCAINRHFKFLFFLHTLFF